MVERITGRTIEFFRLGLPCWREMVHPEDRARWDDAVTRLRSGRAVQEEYRILWPDQSVRWVRDSVRATRTADGKTLRIDGVLADVSDRKRAEEAYSHEQVLLQALMDTLPDNIYFKDRDSKFLRINRELARRFGLTDPQEADGKSDFDFFTPEHARQAFEDEQAMVAGGAPMIDKEEKETWPDGSETWVPPPSCRCATRPGESSAPSASRATSPRANSRGRTAKGEGSRRGRQPGQERVPGQHEPRDPHADERHHRHDRAGCSTRRSDPSSASTWTSSRTPPMRC